MLCDVDMYCRQPGVGRYYHYTIFCSRPGCRPYMAVYKNNCLRYLFVRISYMRVFSGWNKKHYLFQES